MPSTIYFNEKINDSVQIGDDLYQSIIGSGWTGLPPTLVGPITDIGEKYVEVTNYVLPTGTLPASYEVFFSFLKPEHNGHTNVSSLKGYYAEVEFSNDSTEKKEIFVVGSETTISSK